MVSRPIRAVVSLAAVMLALILVQGAAPNVSKSGIASATADPVAIALDYVKKNRAALGLSGADVNDLAVVSVLTDAHTGATHVYLQQQFRGIEISEAHATVNVSRTGNVLSAPVQFFGGVAQLAEGDARLAATDAVAAVARAKALGAPQDLRVTRSRGGPARAVVLSRGGVSASEIPARLVYQQNAAGKLRLAWNVEIEAGDHHWSTNVDADTGEVLWEVDYTVHDDAEHTAAALTSASVLTATATPRAPATVDDGSAYRVFPLPLESPNDGDRTLELAPADALASPFGWHDTNGAPGPEFTITRGNNAWAYADVNNSNGPNAAVPEPNGGPGLQFDFGLDLSTQQPAQYRPAAVTNLFYWCNVIHDVFYRYGFTEEAGNFQANNYGRTTFSGGNNDAVRCEAQDGGGTNNANFNTPADGLTPRMQMYLWPGAARLTVHPPSSAAGVYTISPSAFGPGFPPGGLSASIALANDGSALPTEACGPLVGFPAGAIALVDRGTCPFVDKVQNAQNAGAVAVIIANNVAGTISPGGTSTTITIPSGAITLAQGNTIKAGLPATGTTQLLLTRDGDFDAGIVVHEYGHGISNRLTGGRTVVNCLGNQEQMGEGWSDFLAIALTALPTESGPAPRGMGTYALFQDDPNRSGNGIRPTPYSTDMSINPSTYDLIRTAAVPHGVGYVWATMLWEMFWNLVDVHGFNPNPYGAWHTGGNNLAIQLVMDGMKFQPCQPGFETGRNAILAADDALTGDGTAGSGENKCLIWRAFAKRGLGFSARQGSSGNRNDPAPTQLQAFDNHPDCRPQASRAPASISDALVEGDSSTHTLTVSNLADQYGEDLTWTITEAASDCASPSDLGWVSTDPAAGTTGAAGSSGVDVELDATGLVAPGVYTGKLCLASNGGATLEVALTLQAQFPFGGFVGVIDHPQAGSLATAGQTVPAIFSLGGDRGLAIFAAGSPSSQQVHCTTGAPIGGSSPTQTPGSSTLAYNASTDRYTYPWRTLAGWANTCRVLTLTLSDGTTHSAHFRFVR